MVVFRPSKILFSDSKKGNEQDRVQAEDPFTAEDNNDCDSTIWMRLSGRRSKVWKHFRANRSDRTRVKCDHCPSVFTYSSSTTDFWRHLDSAHNIGRNEEIMTTLVDSGVAEEGSFQISHMYNYLKNLEKRLGVKTQQGVAVSSEI